METLYVSQGNEQEFTLTIVDDDALVIGTYAGTEPLTAAVWTGRGQAARAAPAVTWDDPAAGTVTLTIAAAISAALDTGTYFLKVTVTDTAGPHDVFLGLLAIVASPAAEAVPAVYCTFADLVTYAPQSPKLQSLASDDTQFLPQRSKARQIYEQMILKRYRPQPGRSHRAVDATGQAAGSFVCFAPPPGPVPVPDTATIAAELASDHLVVTEDVVKVNALLAAAEIFCGQPGQQNIYQQLGQDARQAALDLFDRTVLDFDLNSDGLAEIRIDRDVTFLT